MPNWMFASLLALLAIAIASTAIGCHSARGDLRQGRIAEMRVIDQVRQMGTFRPQDLVDERVDRFVVSGGRKDAIDAELVTPWARSRRMTGNCCDPPQVWLLVRGWSVVAAFTMGDWTLPVGTYRVDQPLRPRR